VLWWGAALASWPGPARGPGGACRRSVATGCADRSPPRSPPCGTPHWPGPTGTATSPAAPGGPAPTPPTPQRTPSPAPPPSPVAARAAARSPAQTRQQPAHPRRVSTCPRTTVAPTEQSGLVSRRRDAGNPGIAPGLLDPGLLPSDRAPRCAGPGPFGNAAVDGRPDH